MSLRSVFALALAICLLVPAALAATPTAQARKHAALPTTVVNLDTSGYSTKGTALAGYFRGNSLEKVVARHYGETGKTVEEYAFTNGQLSFLLSTHYRYNGNAAATANTQVARTSATRYYYTAGRLTRVLDAGKSVPLTATRRTDAAQCLTDARTFAQQLQKEKTRLEQAQAAKALFASTGYPNETVKVARARGIDYSLTVQHALARDPKAMHTLFDLSNYTHGASSKDHGAVLGETLRTVGDAYFAACLRKEAADTLGDVRADLYVGFGQLTLHREFPKTYALIKAR